MQYIFVGIAILSAFGVFRSSSMLDSGQEKTRVNGAFLFGMLLVMFVVGVGGCFATAE